MYGTTVVRAVSAILLASMAALTVLLALQPARSFSIGAYGVVLAVAAMAGRGVVTGVLPGTDVRDGRLRSWEPVVDGFTAVAMIVAFLSLGASGLVGALQAHRTAPAVIVPLFTLVMTGMVIALYRRQKREESDAHQTVEG